jgi:hypothetical protein
LPAPPANARRVADRARREHRRRARATRRQRRAPRRARGGTRRRPQRASLRARRRRDGACAATRLGVPARVGDPRSAGRGERMARRVPRRGGRGRAGAAREGPRIRGDGGLSAGCSRQGRRALAGDARALPGPRRPRRNRARAQRRRHRGAARGDWDESRALLEQAADLCRELDERKRLAIVVSNLGRVAAQTGDVVAAKAFTLDALDLEREVGDDMRIAISLNDLGSYAADACKHDEGPPGFPFAAAEAPTEGQSSASTTKRARPRDTGTPSAGLRPCVPQLDRTPTAASRPDGHTSGQRGRRCSR